MNKELTPEQEADLQERLTRAQDGIQTVLDKEQFVLDSTLDTQELKISLPIKLVSTKRYEFDLPEEANPTEEEILGSLKAHDDITYVSDKSNPLEENSAVESLNRATENSIVLDEPVLSPYNTHDDDTDTAN